jgi:deoxycytidylate deaminase
MDKWTRKYLRLAHLLADDNTSCYSRKIGVVLVTKENGSTANGWNGTIRKGPATDSLNYLSRIFRDVMTDEQRAVIARKYGIVHHTEFGLRFEGCRTCPRKLLDIPSGQGLELCNCAHAERNALANANRSGLPTIGSTMYCSCPLPCHECAVQIVQSGVSRVVCMTSVDGRDYSPSSRYLFEQGGVEVTEVDPGDLLRAIQS